MTANLPRAVPVRVPPASCRWFVAAHIWPRSPRASGGIRACRSRPVSMSRDPSISLPPPIGVLAVRVPFVRTCVSPMRLVSFGHRTARWRETHRSQHIEKMASEAGRPLATICNVRHRIAQESPVRALAPRPRSDTRPRCAASCALWWRLGGGVLLAGGEREMAAFGLAEAGVFSLGPDLPQNRCVERCVGRCSVWRRP